MHPFQIVMIISATALFLVAALFLMIRKLPSRPGMEWWLGAALCLAAAYSFGLAFFGAEKSFIGDVIFYALLMMVNLGLFLGTYLFIRKQVAVGRWVKVSLAALLVVIGFRYFQNQIFADLCFSLFNSATLLLAGIALWSAKDVLQKGEKVERLTALFFIFASIHWIDYPFVKNLEWFTPIGFFLGMALAVGIFMCLAALALLQFQEHTKRSEKEAIEAAIRDPLTGLYSRGYMGRLFENYVEKSTQLSLPFAVLYIDLDGFKEINDTYGHHAGDIVLTVLSKRLKNWLGNRGSALRVGGDEIIIFSLLRAEYNEDNVGALAESILSLIEQPIIKGENKFEVSASIGVCGYPLHGKGLDQAISIADDLMYQAKKSGKGTIRYASFPTQEVPGSEVFDSMLISN